MLPCRCLPGPRAFARPAPRAPAAGRRLASALARLARNSTGRWRRVVSALALLALGAPAARAFQLTAIRPVRDPGGQLWVELQIGQAIEPRVAKSLGRGMPATLTLHAELWRKRSGWFDRMERAVEASFRMRYDVWSDRWRLERPGGGSTTVGTLDSLEIALEHTLALPVTRLDKLAPEAACYVVVSASLRPLNVEDVEEVEGWLSGEVREKQRSGLSVLTGLPRSLFEAARNFAGFGDERSRLISAEFTRENLPVVTH